MLVTPPSSLCPSCSSRAAAASARVERLRPRRVANTRGDRCMRIPTRSSRAKLNLIRLTSCFVLACIFHPVKLSDLAHCGIGTSGGQNGPTPRWKAPSTFSRPRKPPKPRGCRSRPALLRRNPTGSPTREVAGLQRYPCSDVTAKQPNNDS